MFGEFFPNKTILVEINNKKLIIRKEKNEKEQTIL